MNTSIKYWFQWFVARREARAWLKHGNAEQIAAHCMWWLNRYARAYDSSRWYIYPMKSLLVKMLYQKGLCYSVRLEEQIMECWHTWEYNNGEESTCYKCNNTDVYRRHYLYRFSFEIGTRFFTWHQPQSLCDFRVQITYPFLSKYEPAHGGGASLGTDMRILYVATVHEYLRMNGIEAEDLPMKVDLRQLIVRKWKWSGRRTRLITGWHNTKQNIGRLWTFITDGYLPELEEEIPF